MNKPHTNNKEVERIVEEFTEKMELYDMGIGLQDNLFDWLRTTLHQELQKAREEVWNKIYQYADRELDGEVWLHGSQIIRRAKEDGVIIDQSELDQPTDCTCDGFDTCYKHSEQLDQTFNPTN